jgi:LCP family protein required for cell wall assembly
MRKKKKMKAWMKIVLSLFIIIALVGGAVFAYTIYQLNKMETTKISKTDEDLGINPVVTKENENSNKITNIALFGVDRKSKDEPARSDSIMILSIDEEHKKIKMSSIMRDTYVKVKGHGETKINHAYAYGGPQLAIRTLNENFNLDIRNYVTVDFFNLEKIIDTMGGVTIDIKEDEIGFTNDKIIEVANIEKKPALLIKNVGPQTLNGLQAVAYSRVRYTAGGDALRTERIKTVLSVMIIKIQSLGASQFPSVVSKLLPLTETSMNSMDIIKLGSKVFTSNIRTLEQETFPKEGYSEGKIMDDGVWYLVTNMDATIDQLHKFIYEDIKPGK